MRWLVFLLCGALISCTPDTASRVSNEKYLKGTVDSVDKVVQVYGKNSEPQIDVAITLDDGRRIGVLCERHSFVYTYYDRCIPLRQGDRVTVYWDSLHWVIP